jgi:tRNA A-37 threonylcarbamoyl transferase component Bud32
LDKLLFDTKEHISNEKKIEWIDEIANGMCHLHKFNIVHRDLASRNKRNNTLSFFDNIRNNDATYC